MQTVGRHGLGRAERSDSIKINLDQSRRQRRDLYQPRARPWAPSPNELPRAESPIYTVGRRTVSLGRNGIITEIVGTRPRLACEVRAEGVVAARAEDAFAVLSAVARVPLADEVVVPRLQSGGGPPDGPA